MQKPIKTRNTLDRLRYALCFELLLIASIAPMLAFILELPVSDTGGLAIILSAKAVLVNLIFNAIYDRIDVHYGRVPTERSALGRTIHAISFESCLVITSLPIIMWWLSMSLWQALLMDLALMAFVVCFTWLYTWCYDRLFPVTQSG